MRLRYWPLGDLFHVVVGIVLMSVVLVGYAATTKWSLRVCQRADLYCEDLLICAPRRALLLAHLQSAIRGANVMGVTVSEDFCVMFCWGVIITIWSVAVNSMQNV